VRGGARSNARGSSPPPSTSNTTLSVVVTSGDYRGRGGDQVLCHRRSLGAVAPQVAQMKMSVGTIVVGVRRIGGLSCLYSGFLYFTDRPDMRLASRGAAKQRHNVASRTTGRGRFNTPFRNRSASSPRELDVAANNTMSLSGTTWRNSVLITQMCLVWPRGGDSTSDHTFIRRRSFRRRTLSFLTDGEYGVFCLSRAAGVSIFRRTNLVCPARLDAREFACRTPSAIAGPVITAHLQGATTRTPFPAIIYIGDLLQFFGSEQTWFQTQQGRLDHYSCSTRRLDRGRPCGSTRTVGVFATVLSGMARTAMVVGDQQTISPRPALNTCRRPSTSHARFR